MSKLRLIATTAGTLGCAFAIGLFMQSTGPVKQKALSLKAPEITQAELSSTDPRLTWDICTTDDPVIGDGMPLEVTGIELTSMSMDHEEMGENLLSHPDNFGISKPPSLVELAKPDAPFRGCEIQVSAAPLEPASVALEIDAPCNPNERISLHHMGMIVSETPSVEGRLQVTIPALSQKAVFMIVPDSNGAVVATAEVPSLADYDRVALQWAGDGGFQIHAREFGADYGSAGHVWAESTSLAGEEGGQVARLGDPTLANANFAEIYTFPKSRSKQGGTIALTVEAEVTEKNCGRDIAAQSIELRDADLPRTQDLVLSVPECSSVGDFLVLNNLIDDLKIAAR